MYLILKILKQNKIYLGALLLMYILVRSTSTFVNGLGGTLEHYVDCVFVYVHAAFGIMSPTVSKL